MLRQHDEAAVEEEDDGDRGMATAGAAVVVLRAGNRRGNADSSIDGSVGCDPASSS